MFSCRLLRDNWLIATFAILLAGGCKSEQLDPETVAIRESVLLADEPAGAMTLTELAAQLDVAANKTATISATDSTSDTAPVSEGEAIPAESATDSTSQSVVVVGRIFAGEMEPWDPGKASFLLAELPDEGHGEGHDADNCPFCKRKAARAPTAIVQLVDDSGQVLAVDARKLLGVQSKDVVVVRGSVTPGELNSLVITARDLHVRRR